MAAVVGLVAGLTPIGVSSAATGPAFVATKTVTRINYNNGADVPVDSRNVTVTVSQTQELRDRQGITVTWSGAHPTGGIAEDDTTSTGAYEEYPVVVMQCRGEDSASVPTAKQVSPETCWTQTPFERFGYSTSNQYPAFRMDRYATAADRDYNVDQPPNLPATCTNAGDVVTHWVPYIGANGVSYPGGYQGCAGIAPDESLTSEATSPGSTTYGSADANGDGSTNFIIQSDLSNASLGCSATVPCTLEVIPIEGISCDPAGAVPAPGGMPAGEGPSAQLVPFITSKCEDSGVFSPGSFNTGNTPDFSSTTGQYWWSPSNWRNRISVPLTFASAADVCDSITSESSLLVYGTETLLQATQQWAPALCLNSKLGFQLRHVQSSEPEAKNLLASGSIEAAYQAAPPDTPFTTPTVQAPTAVTGWAIAADVDGADGNPVPVRLDARLLAKLLTESYEGCALDCLSDPSLVSNPYDITRDPEFQALNPDVPPTNYLAAAAALAFISSNSDVVSAVTAYINDDPEARAWLDGRPDPWGMVVNPAYEGITLPVNQWPLLDTHIASVYSSSNPCVGSDGSPPWLPLVAAPLENPALIALNMQYAISNAEVGCANVGQVDQKLTALGRQTPGSLFLLGVVSLADADRYELATASLETQRTTDSMDVFSTAAGRSFAAPTTASLLAAAKMLKPDDATGTWPVPYDAMRTEMPAGTNAYPGIMLVSTDVPTRGLPKSDATDYGKLLTFEAGTAQTPGLGNGQLPDGYLPITKANGLGALAAYTDAAATDVAAQQCVVPFPSGKAAPAPSCNLPAAPPSGGSPTKTSSTPTKPNESTPSIPAPSSAAPSSSPMPSSSASSAPTLVRTGRTVALRAGVLGVALPVMALLAVLGGALSIFTKRRAR